jgi:mannose-6-phosphate isomerase-like protein (cupin superfamily)
MDTINVKEAFTHVDKMFAHRIIGEINDMYVKLVKIDREFIWHSHDWEDEMFFVVQGHLRMHYRDRTVDIKPGEFVIVPHGVEHKPEATSETHVMLIEPKATDNTGGQESELRHAPEWI